MMSYKKFLGIGIIIFSALQIMVLCSIFNFSAQTGEVSSGLSSKIVTFLTGLKNTPENAELFAKFSFYVRKAAHITVFFLCAITAFLAILSLGRYTGKYNWVISALVAGIYSFAMACLDEFHQSFVDGRGPAFSDVGIDMIGVTLALVVGCTGFLIARNIKNKRKGIKNTNE